jgi:hypothetical protein
VLLLLLLLKRKGGRGKGVGGCRAVGDGRRVLFGSWVGFQSELAPEQSVRVVCVVHVEVVSGVRHDDDLAPIVPLAPHRPQRLLAPVGAHPVLFAVRKRDLYVFLAEGGHAGGDGESAKGAGFEEGADGIFATAGEGDDVGQVGVKVACEGGGGGAEFFEAVVGVLAKKEEWSWDGEDWAKGYKGGREMKRREGIEISQGRNASGGARGDPYLADEKRA